MMGVIDGLSITGVTDGQLIIGVGEGLSNIVADENGNE